LQIDVIYDVAKNISDCRVRIKLYGLLPYI
jgi:hypothetical protein